MATAATGSASPVPSAGLRPVRRRLGPRAALAALCGLAVVGGSTAAAVAYVDDRTPTEVVRTYLQALRSGNAEQALAQGDLPTGDRRFLTAAVLRRQQRLGRIDVRGVFQTVRHATTATVVVDYRLESPTTAPARQESVTLHRRSRHWRLSAVAVPATVVVDGPPHRATLAGSTVASGPVLLFPGAVPVEYDTDRLQTGPGTGVVGLTTGGEVRVRVELSLAGAVAAQDIVRRAMDACLRAARPPASCPLDSSRSRAVPGSLRGRVAAIEASEGPDVVSGDADGLVELRGQFRVKGSWQALDFEDIAGRRSGSTTAPFAAQLYLTGRPAVSWTGP
ncbi:MAG: hypothetical protein ABJA87_12455 [bacterium]